MRLDNRPYHPIIDREPTEEDKETYQDRQCQETAVRVAAPTAGFAFYGRIKAEN
jgi:S-adenosylmethionine:tRNA-ribosyltransferase-isomerase (queuine synthetase)